MTKKQSGPTKPKSCTADHVREQTKDPMWLLPAIQSIDTALSGRWMWWCGRLMDGEIGDHKIPPINLQAYPSRQSKPPYALSDAILREVGPASDIKKQFMSVLNATRMHGHSTLNVLQWFLYGLHPKGVIERPKFDDDLEVKLYQDGVQALVRMMAYPGDWAADIMCEIFDGSKSGTAWFPTPGDLAMLLAQMAISDGDNRAKSAHDPCCGTGVTLLYTSNHCLDLSGQDIDGTMIAWTQLQGYLFAPWMVYGDKSSIREIRENRLKTLIKKTNTEKRRKMPKRAKLNR